MKETKRKIRMPKKSSDRKRPNKKFIMQMVAFRGGIMTGNEKTILTGLKVKNSLQKIYNRAMSTDVTLVFNSAENKELQTMMKEFVKGVNVVLNIKKKLRKESK